MPKTYSLYDAKARFSQVIREVRDGDTVTISYRGAAVAEIRPVAKTTPQSLAARIEALERSGEIIPAAAPDFHFEATADMPGALQEFLKDRDE